MPNGLLDLGLIDGQNWGAAALDAIEAAINYGPVICTSGTRPAGVVGRTIWETDKQRLWVCTVAGTPGTWKLISGAMPWVHACTANTQSIPHAAFTTVNYVSEFTDADGFHSTVSNTGRLTIPAGFGGMYSLWFNHYAPSSIAGGMEMFIAVNGSTTVRYGWHKHYFGSSSEDTIISGAAVIPLAAGDYVEVQCYQTNGSTAARNIGAVSNYSSFFASMIGQY